MESNSKKSDKRSTFTMNPTTLEFNPAGSKNLSVSSDAGAQQKDNSFQPLIPEGNSKQHGSSGLSDHNSSRENVSGSGAESEYHGLSSSFFGRLLGIHASGNGATRGQPTKDVGQPSRSAETRSGHLHASQQQAPGAANDASDAVGAFGTFGAAGAASALGAAAAVHKNSTTGVPEHSSHAAVHAAHSHGPRDSPELNLGTLFPEGKEIQGDMSAESVEPLPAATGASSSSKKKKNKKKKNAQAAAALVAGTSGSSPLGNQVHHAHSTGHPHVVVPHHARKGSGDDDEIDESTAQKHSHSGGDEENSQNSSDQRYHPTKEQRQHSVNLHGHQGLERQDNRASVESRPIHYAGTPSGKSTLPRSGSIAPADVESEMHFEAAHASAFPSTNLRRGLDSQELHAEIKQRRRHIQDEDEDEDEEDFDKPTVNIGQLPYDERFSSPDRHLGDTAEDSYSGQEPGQFEMTDKGKSGSHSSTGTAAAVGAGVVGLGVAAAASRAAVRRDQSDASSNRQFDSPMTHHDPSAIQKEDHAPQGSLFTQPATYREPSTSSSSMPRGVSADPMHHSHAAPIYHAPSSMVHRSTLPSSKPVGLSDGDRGGPSYAPSAPAQPSDHRQHAPMPIENIHEPYHGTSNAHSGPAAHRVQGRMHIETIHKPYGGPVQVPLSHATSTSSTSSPVSTNPQKKTTWYGVEVSSKEKKNPSASRPFSLGFGYKEHKKAAVAAKKDNPAIAAAAVPLPSSPAAYPSVMSFQPHKFASRHDAGSVHSFSPSQDRPVHVEESYHVPHGAISRSKSMNAAHKGHYLSHSKSFSSKPSTPKVLPSYVPANMRRSHLPPPQAAANAPGSTSTMQKPMPGQVSHQSAIVAPTPVQGVNSNISPVRALATTAAIAVPIAAGSAAVVHHQRDNNSTAATLKKPNADLSLYDEEEGSYPRGENDKHENPRPGPHPTGVADFSSSSSVPKASMAAQIAAAATLPVAAGAALASKVGKNSHPEYHSTGAALKKPNTDLSLYEEEEGSYPRGQKDEHENPTHPDPPIGVTEEVQLDEDQMHARHDAHLTVTDKVKEALGGLAPKLSSKSSKKKKKKNRVDSSAATVGGIGAGASAVGVAAALRAANSDNKDADSSNDDKDNIHSISDRKVEPVSVIPTTGSSVLVTDKATTTHPSGEVTSHVMDAQPGVQSSSLDRSKAGKMTDNSTSTTKDTKEHHPISSTAAALSAATAAVAAGAATTAAKIKDAFKGHEKDDETIGEENAGESSGAGAIKFLTIPRDTGAYSVTDHGDNVDELDAADNGPDTYIEKTTVTEDKLYARVPHNDDEEADVVQTTTMTEVTRLDEEADPETEGSSSKVQDGDDTEKVKKERKPLNISAKISSVAAPAAAAFTAAAVAYNQRQPAAKKPILQLGEHDVHHPGVPIVSRRFMLTEDDVEKPTVPEVGHILTLTEDDVYKPTVPVVSHLLTLTEDDVYKPVPTLTAPPMLRFTEDDVEKPDPSGASHPVIPVIAPKAYSNKANKIASAARPMIPAKPVQGKDLKLPSMPVMPVMRLPPMPKMSAPKMPKAKKLKMPRFSAPKMPIVNMPTLSRKKKSQVAPEIKTVAVIAAPVVALEGVRTHVVETPRLAAIEAPPHIPIESPKPIIIVAPKTMIAEPISTTIEPPEPALIEAHTPLMIEPPKPVVVETPRSPAPVKAVVVAAAVAAPIAAVATRQKTPIVIKPPTPPPALIMKAPTPPPAPIMKAPTSPPAPAVRAPTPPPEPLAVPAPPAGYNGPIPSVDDSDTVLWVKKIQTTQYFYDSADEDEEDLDEYGHRKDRDVSRYIAPAGGRGASKEMDRRVNYNIGNHTRPQGFQGQPVQPQNVYQYEAAQQRQGTISTNGLQGNFGGYNPQPRKAPF